MGVRGPEPHDELVRRYADGWTLLRLATRYGVAARRVRAILRGAGVPIRGHGPNGRPPRRGPEPPHGELVRLYVEVGWSLEGLAERYQVGPKRVRGILLSEGATIRGPGTHTYSPKRRPEPPHDELVRLYVEDGWTLARLSKRYRIGARRVRAIILDEGITLARPRNQRAPEPPHDELMRLYKNGWTINQLCQRYRVGHPRIRAILVDHEVQIRPANCPPRSRPGQSQSRIEVSPDQAQAMAESYRNGATLTAIGRQTYVSVTVVKRILAAQKVPLRTRHGWRPPPPAVDPDELSAYYQAGNSLADAAEKFGISVRRLRNILITADVEIRQRGGTRPRSAG